MHVIRDWARGQPEEMACGIRDLCRTLDCVLTEPRTSA